MTRSDQWKKRPATTRYWEFKDALRAEVRGNLEPCFDIDFFIPMPKSWSHKKKAEMSGKPHQVKPDVDNFLKAFMDCLCEDDSYIWDVHPRKFWAATGAIELTERV
jgi:Holliday junction resolvase RusA-like endonuclease